MELAWLEDFLELVATRNYLAAASARSISQPAFSRRIMALEKWIGAPLINRSTYPIKLTQAGTLFLPRCRELVQDLYRLRAECRQQAGPMRLKLSFAALHTIAMFQFPRWICKVEESMGSIMCTMHADDFHECIEQLSMGKCDFAMMYDHPDGPPVLRAGPFASIVLGKEPLVPVSAAGPDGKPLHQLIPDSDRPVPYLAYSWNDGYVGRLVALVQARQKHAIQLSTVYESALAEGIKRMAIAGKGVGWLPLSCVADAIDRGELSQIGGPELTLEMDVRLYRHQGIGSPEVEEFWQGLLRPAPTAAKRPERQQAVRSGPPSPSSRLPRQGSGADIFNAKIT